MNMMALPQHELSAGWAMPAGPDPDLWEGATFMPHDHPSRIDALVQEVVRRRRVTFLALSLWVSVKEPGLSRRTGFADAVERFKSLPRGAQQEFIEFPAFLVWLKGGLPASGTESQGGGSGVLEEKLAELARIMSSFERGVE